jgi:ubiquinone/menaquinone biosynthesis C-methylase UbiE/uncharacterized protein YbaR (Trm112 family)
MTSPENQFIKDNIGFFCCPRCTGNLAIDRENLTCQNCSQKYPISHDIPRLFWPNEWDPGKEDVTEQIKDFYEETPFPDYDDFDDVGSLIEKSRQGIFAKLLDDQIPYGTRILECGCGTGQLTNFLSVANRTVIGTDICINSLKMAQDFKDQNELNNAQFIQMNLFRPCLKSDRFDLVICNGVLHHTSDPLMGFRSLCRLVKPRGYILIGLYHKYGRIYTDIRRFLFRLSRDKLKFLDRRTMDENISQAKRKAWFTDQYKNPHESKHTIGEVLRWLAEAGFNFVKSIPKPVPFEGFRESEKLFQPDTPGNKLTRFLVESSKILTGSGEGGFFIVIAKKTGQARDLKINGDIEHG